jgi:hypothetical protein
MSKKQPLCDLVWEPSKDRQNRFGRDRGDEEKPQRSRTRIRHHSGSAQRQKGARNRAPLQALERLRVGMVYGAIWNHFGHLGCEQTQSPGATAAAACRRHHLTRSHANLAQCCPTLRRGLPSRLVSSRRSHDVPRRSYSRTVDMIQSRLQEGGGISY